MARRLLTKKPFEFSARVTMQLGRESISSSTVAVSELIKNSYDANSNNVSIDFTIRNKATSTLVIKDDGEGMSVDDLLERWLTVGTDNKSKIEFSRDNKRVLTGAKGLGRLGIDRLCKLLILYTKTAGMEHAIQLVVDWRKYEGTGLKLSEIKHEIYEVEIPASDRYGPIFSGKDDHGTRLVLVGLKDPWNEGFLSALENELRLLVSPLSAQNDFSIDLSIQKNDTLTERKKLSSEEFLSLARWEVVANVNSEGLVAAKYINRVKDTEQRTATEWNQWIKGFGDKPTFGPLSIKFYYIPQQQQDVLNKVNLKYRDLNKFMKMNRGFRIYRDNFRVRPYGEPSGKGDWLDLGLRKASSPGGIAQGGWRIGPNQVLGVVTISRTTNSVLNDQANREGIVENFAYFQLKAFVLKVIATFESLAHEDAASDNRIVPIENLVSMLEKISKETDDVVGELKDYVSNNNRGSHSKKGIPPKILLKKQLENFEKAQEKQKDLQKKYIEAVQAEKQQLQEQKDTLSNLASLGILTVCFGHEIRQHTSQAATNALAIEDIIDDAENGYIEIDYPECKNLAESIRKNIFYIDNFSQLALSNIKPDKRKQKKVNIPNVIDYVFGFMKPTLDIMGIKFDPIFNNIPPSDINVWAFEIDWESIAINLFTNSQWALESVPSDNRFIQFEYSLLDNGLIQIIYRDSGIGLEAGTESSIFQPMVSGKRDREGNQIGTGMGLAIVRNQIVEHSSGTVRAVAKGKLGGAEFIFELPVA
ncbi:signal transduction histidine kinase [Rheinheimera pacifica]|uniref:sensor histidine kinase n=1 Tax=Rheinheimera pacifica TaxID=173990 RepID=UPI00285576AD|nr:sensor histidine kinase [Rheinheimera pacifica]MDR6985384.1 signal transduction histidine kinase [Rheinheimera pacifica]